jgi:acetoin utilization deacetylase AcuC-like enzyme
MAAASSAVFERDEASRRRQQQCAVHWLAASELLEPGNPNGARAPPPASTYSALPTAAAGGAAATGGAEAEPLYDPDTDDEESEDTFVSSGSWQAALWAAGVVTAAVDRVLLASAAGTEAGQTAWRSCPHPPAAADGGTSSSPDAPLPAPPPATNAFCLVRPPGHHAGRCGSTHGCETNGFCLLNNVVLGLMHARLKWGLRRVAVIDIDAHFGNGTAELLRGDGEAFFASVHMHSGAAESSGAASGSTSGAASGAAESGSESEDGDSFFPGPCAATEIRGPNYLSIAVGAATRAVRQRNLMRIRAGAGGGLLYRQSQTGDLDPRKGSGAVSNGDGGAVGDGGDGGGTDSDEDGDGAGGDGQSARPTATPPPPLASLRGPAGFRAALRGHILPALRRFNPELVMISAGFDGLASDPVGGKLGLAVQDIAWATRQVVRAAAECTACSGRVVSVLEGGYDLAPRSDGLSQAVQEHVRALMRPQVTGEG